VSVDQPDRLAAVAERLREQTSVPGLLRTTAQSYVEVLDSPACTISRVIGDLLVDLIQHQREGKPERLGHGYLISDYPLTRAVIEERAPRMVFSGDPDADQNEVKLLQELGFDSLLMVAIQGHEGAWGLVEVYGDKGRRFDDDDATLAQDVADRVGEILRVLERRP
jgi:GAF domain-containing protein